MADNYLERKMEDYRSGKSLMRTSAPVRRTRTAAMRAFVVEGCSERGAEAIRQLRRCGWQVAFSCADLKAGRETAQATGSQHYPIAADNADALGEAFACVIGRWGGLELILDCSGCGDGTAGTVTVDGVKVAKINI